MENLPSSPSKGSLKKKKSGYGDCSVGKDGIEVEFEVPEELR
jgi:hypothetical protein